MPYSYTNIGNKAISEIIQVNKTTKISNGILNIFLMPIHLLHIFEGVNNAKIIIITANAPPYNKEISPYAILSLFSIR